MVVLRLRREGTKNRPFYRIVAADQRMPRDGRFLEILGTYDPLMEGDNVTVNLDKANAWIAKGAQASETVRSLLKKAGKAAVAAK
jgi:small subunit ribosomal protein S16